MDNLIAKAISKDRIIMALLLVLGVLCFAWTVLEKSKKSQILDEITYKAKTASIYVVPNSQIKAEKPADYQILLSSFVDYVSQSLLTYTSGTIFSQYRSIKHLMSPLMLERADAFYLLDQSKISNKFENKSSLFELDRTSTEVKEIQKYSEDFGGKVYEVVLKGKRRDIVRGNIEKPKDITVNMQIQETSISKTNPYGFIITKFDLEKII